MQCYSLSNTICNLQVKPLCPHSGGVTRPLLSTDIWSLLFFFFLFHTFNLVLFALGKTMQKPGDPFDPTLSHHPSLNVQENVFDFLLLWKVILPYGNSECLELREEPGYVLLQVSSGRLKPRGHGSLVLSVGLLKVICCFFPINLLLYLFQYSPVKIFAKMKSGLSSWRSRSLSP